MTTRWFEIPLCVAAVLVLLDTPAAAQMGLGARIAGADSLPPENEIIWMSPINVTATRVSTDVFRTPSAVTVLGREDLLDRAPDTVTDLFRELPGLDANGVGPNQTRPTIRGQRGQRILLLEDGMRLNNTRRQQDFGELVGLVDVSIIERVEVVRGPASVLYGSDAIGGVVNMITKVPDEDESLSGDVRYRYSTHDAQNKVEAGLSAGTAGSALSPTRPWGRPTSTRLQRAASATSGSRTRHASTTRGRGRERVSARGFCSDRESARVRQVRALSRGRCRIRVRGSLVLRPGAAVRSRTRWSG